jgi:hypothetical protein
MNNDRAWMQRQRGVDLRPAQWPSFWEFQTWLAWRFARGWLDNA